MGRASGSAGSSRTLSPRGSRTQPSGPAAEPGAASAAARRTSRRGGPRTRARSPRSLARSPARSLARYALVQQRCFATNCGERCPTPPPCCHHVLQSVARFAVNDAAFDPATPRGFAYDSNRERCRFCCVEDTLCWERQRLRLSGRF